MKKIGLIFICFYMGLIKSSFGQETNYTQYFLNLPAINPAFTGIDDFLDINIGYRQGWNNFNDTNSSVYLSAFGTLNKPLRYMIKNNALRVSNPAIIKKMQNDKRVRRKHGIGGAVNNIKLGPSTLNSIQLNYAYHLPVSKNFNWSFGTRINYMQRSIDFSDFTVRDEVNDLFYQELINSGAGIQNLLLLDFGTVLYSENLYFGISSNSLILTELTNENMMDYSLLKSYQLQSGKVLAAGYNFDLNISIAASFHDVNGISWNASVRGKYKDLIYAGIAYEDKKKISTLVGLFYDQTLGIHYSYDHFISDLSSFNVTSHEINIELVLFNKYDINRKFW